MTSFIQPFDTSLFRRIGSGQGDPGPLSADYLFGLADNPFADNLFPMPDGNLRFPGYLTWGAHRFGSAVSFFGSRAAVSSSPPAFGLISLADTHNSGGGPGAFFILEDNDPAWNGLFSSLATAWTAEIVSYSNSTDQTSAHDGTQFGRRAYNPYGASPINYPNVSRPGLSMIAEMALFNSSAGDVEITERLTGYGQYEIQLYNIEPGACGQWVTHWNNHALAPAAGDGPAWLIDVDGRFNTFSAGAGLQAYQRGADAQNSAWGWKLLGRDAALNIQDILDVTTDGGLLNGATIATLDAGATVIENYLSAKIDLTITSSGNLVVPARPGMVFVPREILALTTDVGGAFTTPPSITVTSGAHAINGGAPQNLPTVQQFDKGNFAALALVPPAGNGLIANTPILVNVTTAATGTGGFVYKCTYAIKGYWQALP